MTNKTWITMTLAACLMLWSCDDTSKKTEGCGNDIVETGEACDGTDFAGMTCASFGQPAGHLTCTSECTLDLSQCRAVAECGDGFIDDGEVCDTNQFGEITCASFGHEAGVLVCTETCTIDSSGCHDLVDCGNGILEEGETCDGTELAGATCETLGYGGGTLSCALTCLFDEGQCTMDLISPNVGTLIHVPTGTPSNLSVVSAFRMSKYEITRAQWGPVTGWADPSDNTASYSLLDPVQNVNWYYAIAFCNKLSLLEGLTPVYTVSGVDFSTLQDWEIPTSDNTAWNAATADWEANGYRLPTEMEWMWAAMGADTANPGAVNTTGYTKAFAGSTGSNFIGDYAVFGYGTSETGRTTTQRTNMAGSKLANELGFYDLSGNVYEWIWDWAEASYPTGTVTDYRGPASGTWRMRRGGDWVDGASACAMADWNASPPGNRFKTFGFRVVRN